MEIFVFAIGYITLVFIGALVVIGVGYWLNFVTKGGSHAKSDHLNEYEMSSVRELIGRGFYLLEAADRIKRENDAAGMYRGTPTIMTYDYQQIKKKTK